MIININNFVFDSSQIKILTPIEYRVLVVLGQATHIKVECTFEVQLESRTFVFRFKYDDMDLYNDAFCIDKKDVGGNKIYVDFQVNDLSDAENIDYTVNSHIRNNFADRINLNGITLLRERLINYMRTKEDNGFRLVPFFELSDFNTTKLHE